MCRANELHIGCLERRINGMVEEKYGKLSLESLIQKEWFFYMKLCIWLATLILAITQRGAAKRIDAAHQINLADVNLGDLIEKVLPSLDISKPLYELGKIVNRGGQAVSPGLAKAGKFSTSAGIALINIGTLLNASS